MTVSMQSVLAGDRRAMAAVRLLRRLTRVELVQVVTLMPELRALPAQMPFHESLEEYWRRVLHEERGGYQLTLDDKFLEGLTYREYFALPEAEQNTFWDKIFKEDAWEIEDFEEVDVRPDIAVAAG